mgnify:CR=1 FL=1
MEKDENKTAEEEAALTNALLVAEGKTSGNPRAGGTETKENNAESNEKKAKKTAKAKKTQSETMGENEDFSRSVTAPLGKSSEKRAALALVFVIALIVLLAAGAIAKKYLREQFGIEVRGFLSQIGEVKIAPQTVGKIDWDKVNSNPFFCPDESAVEKFDELIRELKKEGDSIGAKLTVIAENVPVGLGEPVFDRLDADLAHALMGINAVKGVEIGDGFAVVEQRGSEHRDEMTPNGFESNHAGGILGGISSGQPIITTIALKPTSSIAIPGRSINLEGDPVEVVTKGRHDPCVGIRAVPIAEAMVAIVLLDHLLRFKAQCR